MKVITNALIFVLILTFCHSAMAERSIYLVRHAEKQIDGTKNPALTPQGLTRAHNIAKLLEDKNITAIYSTQYKRTLQTAAPLATKLGVKVKTYNPNKLKSFATDVLKSKGNLLIVGHSNTTPDLSIHLGGENFGEIDESEYDRVYQLKFTDKQVESVLLHSQPTLK